MKIMIKYGFKLVDTIILLLTIVVGILELFTNIDLKGAILFLTMYIFISLLRLGKIKYIVSEMSKLLTEEQKKEFKL